MAAGRKRTYRSAPRRSRALLVVTAKLAEKIRVLRTQQNLTQQVASDRADLETKHWQLLEAGGTNPTLATLIAIAKALDVELYELLK